MGSRESNSDGRSDNSRIDGESRGGTYSRSVMSSQEGNNNNSSSAVGVGGGGGGSVGVRNESSRGDRYKSNTTATTATTNTTSGSTGAVGHAELSSKSDAQNTTHNNTHNTTHSTTQGGSSTLDTYRKNIANSNNSSNNNSSSSSNLKSASPPFTHDKSLGKTTTSFSTSKNAATNDPTQSHMRDSKNTEMDTGTCMRSTAINLS